MPSAVWWTQPRLRTSRCSWPQTEPGRSAVSWSWRPAGPDGQCITSAPQYCLFLPLLLGEGSPYNDVSRDLSGKKTSPGVLDSPPVSCYTARVYSINAIKGEHWRE